MNMHLEPPFSCPWFENFLEASAGQPSSLEILATEIAFSKTLGLYRE
jgi:hypothetical protein